MEFRSKLMATLRAIRPILEEPGALVVGSEVPNLLEADAAATLIRSQDVDVGVAVASHPAVKARLSEIRELRPSGEEPSVWLPARPCSRPTRGCRTPPPTAGASPASCTA